MIKAILLDCGGVVVYPPSGEWLEPANIERIMGGKRPVYDPAKAAEAFKNHAHLMDEGQLITGIGHEYAQRLEFNRRMNEDLGTGLSEAQIRQVCDYLTYDDSKYTLYPDSREVIDRLADKYRVGFLSNALPSMIRALDTSGVTARLSCFTVSCLLGCQKPDEGIYLAALRELHLESSECVFVEDLKANLLTARRLGFNTIRMCRERYLKNPMPDFAWSGAVARELVDVERLVELHNAGKIDLGA